jgi:hypothetical protein
MNRKYVRTQLVAWLFLPIVGIGIATIANYFVVCGTGFPLILYLIWGFPCFEQLSTSCRKVFHFNLAIWAILYLQALWLPALFLFIKDKKLSGTAAAMIWGTTLLACVVSLIWQAI